MKKFKYLKPQFWFQSGDPHEKIHSFIPGGVPDRGWSAFGFGNLGTERFGGNSDGEYGPRLET